MLKVFKESCKNCLLSSNRIVPDSVAKQIIKECISEQTHFICHKATINGKEIVCNRFYNKLGDKSQLIRIAKRLGFIEFVEQFDFEKLKSYKEQKNMKKSDIIKGSQLLRDIEALNEVIARVNEGLSYFNLVSDCPIDLGIRVQLFTETNGFKSNFSYNDMSIDCQKNIMMILLQGYTKELEQKEKELEEL